MRQPRYVGCELKPELAMVVLLQQTSFASACVVDGLGQFLNHAKQPLAPVHLSPDLGWRYPKRRPQNDDVVEQVNAAWFKTGLHLELGKAGLTLPGRMTAS